MGCFDSKRLEDDGLWEPLELVGRMIKIEKSLIFSSAKCPKYALIFVHFTQLRKIKGPLLFFGKN